MIADTMKWKNLRMIFFTHFTKFFCVIYLVYDLFCNEDKAWVSNFLNHKFLYHRIIKESNSFRGYKSLNKHKGIHMLQHNL